MKRPHRDHRRRRKPRPGTAKPAAPRPADQMRTDWGGDVVARWYDGLVGEAGSDFHRHVVIPGVLRLLRPHPGQSMLDLACGQGVLCRILHDRGIEMTGVDAARELIQAARERSGDESIRYVVGDARDISFLPEGAFDAVSCILAIQNIHPLRPVFDGVARVLKPGGALVMVMMHPAFRGPKETSWGWDQAKGVQYRRVDRYLVPRKHPIVTHPGKQADVYTWTFHKPIEAYAKALRGAGLLIDAIEEWPSHKTSSPGPRATAENTARKEIPLFMAIRALKVQTAGTTDYTDDAGS